MSEEIKWSRYGTKYERARKDIAQRREKGGEWRTIVEDYKKKQHFNSATALALLDTADKEHGKRLETAKALQAFTGIDEEVCKDVINLSKLARFKGAVAYAISKGATYDELKGIDIRSYKFSEKLWNEFVRAEKEITIMIVILEEFGYRGTKGVSMMAPSLRDLAKEMKMDYKDILLGFLSLNKNDTENKIVLW